MLFLKIILFLLFILVFTTTVYLLGYALSGRVRRAYRVLDSSQPVHVAGENFPVSELAARYRPITRLNSSLFTPPLLWDFYEVIEEDTAYVIQYYHVWEDEIHPDQATNFLYRLYRAAYYGYPVRDIEYFQVNVEKISGQVSLLCFETSPGEDYYVSKSKHVVARYTRVGDAVFDLTLNERSGEWIADHPAQRVDFVGRQVLTAPATWNHLTRLVNAGDAVYDRLCQVPLRPLTEAEYRVYKFARKSHGDYRTQENPRLRRVMQVIRAFASLAAAIVGFLWAFN